MPRNQRTGYARPYCPVRPRVRVDDLPPNAIDCGHCDRYIEAGMEVGYCPIHRWLCSECIP